jgi:hydroxymethylbilane synthase
MSMPTTQIITLGSRPSKLARWQTQHILDQLKTAWPEFTCRVVTLVTEGDKNVTQALPEIGGKGVFTSELETALRSGEIDLAVHSLKDLPVDSSAGLSIGAVGLRADARDVLITANGQNLANLPVGARVGTSSLRRQAQLKAARPDLTILPLRGNVDTRIRKALEGDYDAIILAAAGVERLDLGKYITEYLPLEVLLPAPGQGALAVQCRADDNEVLKLLESVHHLATYQAVTAERAFLSSLGAGCSAPVAAYANYNSGMLEINGLVASTDGQQVIRVYASGEDPLALGKRLAQQALVLGAGELLK